MSMFLNDVDRGSVAWGKAIKYCEERLAVLQRQNEADISPEATAKIRGRIAEIKSFMRAGEPPREVVAGD